MYDQLTVPAITSEQRQELRQADYLGFLYQEGESYIRACKENVGIWKETKEIRIPCGTQLSNYGQRNGLGAIKEAWYYADHLQWQPHILTAISKIRKGDKLVLHWVANNNSKLLDEAGLYHDQLYLIVVKPSGKLDTFYIGDRVCQNNSAKMIQHDVL